MGFLDKIFKPKWKHKDYYIRLQAVRELDDQKALIEIAKTDSSRVVREDAVKKINDISVLRDIANNDSEYYVRKEAVKRFRDKIGTIDDESVLIDIAKNDSNYDVRKEAVKKISDESVLIDIAKNDSEGDVREEAVKKINDNSVLIDIAKNDSANRVRLAAIKNIDDESLLIDVAKNTSDNNVRETILKHYKTKYIDKIINCSNFYNDSLKEFEKKNYKTFSIYDLENHDVLMCHTDGSIFTNWDNIYCQNGYLSGSSIKSSSVIDNEFHSIKYVSEDFSNKNHIQKRKYEYTSERISIKEVQDPATDYWVDSITTRSKFSRLEATVIIGITDKITDLSEMFYGCKAKTISFVNCDFSNVVHTKDIFFGCNNLETIHADETSLNSLITFVPESKQYIDNLP